MHHRYYGALCPLSDLHSFASNHIISNLRRALLTPVHKKYIAEAFRPYGDVFTEQTLLSVSPLLFFPGCNRILAVRNPVTPTPRIQPHVRIARFLQRNHVWRG